MFSALRDGADGSFPLYALIIWGWEKLFGSSDLSLRLNSGLFVLLFVWHSNTRLCKYFPAPIAALAILFALSEPNFTYYALQARFYGLVILLFSLCFWSTWDLIQNANSSRWHRLGHASICGLLCLSHPLGLVYTGLLGALYLGFSGVLKSFSFLNGLSFLGGPALFLLWLPSFLRQRLVNPSYHDILIEPWWIKYWVFAFFNSKVLFVTVIVGLLLFIVGCWVFKSKEEGGVSDKGVRPNGGGDTIQHRETVETVEQSRQHLDTQLKLGVNERRGFKELFRRCIGLNYLGQSDKTLLLLFSIAFIVALNGAIAVLDWGRIIPVYWMKAVRYVLVCWVAYCVVVAAVLTGAAGLICRACRPNWDRLAGRMQFFAVLTGLLLLLGSYWNGWVKEKTEEQSYLLEVSRIANEKHLTVVCDSHWDAFFLATRTPADHVTYLLEEDYPFARFLLQVSKDYPRPTPIYPFKSGLSLSEQLRSTNAYLFVRRSPREAQIVTPTKRPLSGSD